jgi:hypothetical protein
MLFASENYLMVLRLFFITIFFTIFVASPTRASLSEDRDELLFRKDGKLYLVDVTAGISVHLREIQSDFSDYWYWSPDGNYLMGMVEDGQIADYPRSLHIYDVENTAWIEGINIGLGFSSNLAWLPDSKRFSYGIDHKNWAEIRIHDLESGLDKALYTSPESYNIYGDGVGQQWWSPDGMHLLFTTYVGGMAGSTNSLYVAKSDGTGMSMITSAYYGTYYSVWSPDGKWFLLSMRGDYTDSNSHGDLYLYSAAGGSALRLTSTPDFSEFNYHWSSDSTSIHFEADHESITLELASATDDTGLPSVIRIAHEATPEKTKLGDHETLSPDSIRVAYLIDKGKGYDRGIGSKRDERQSLTKKVSDERTALCQPRRVLWGHAGSACRGQMRACVSRNCAD